MDLSIKKLINDFSRDELMFEYHNKGLLRLTGKDSFKFLNGISSNEVKNLKGEQSISSLILTNKGRILFHIEIYSDSPDSMFVIYDLIQKEDIIGYLKKYRMSYKIEIDDLDESLTIFKGRNLSKELFFKKFKSSQILEEKLSVFLVPNNKINSIKISLTNENYYSAWKILNGVPSSSKEITSKTIPIEANMWSSISFTKGCYIGQETIARIHYRGKIKRSLSCLNIDGKLGNEVDIFNSENKEIGIITNSVYFASENNTLALAYIDDDQNHENNSLTVSNKVCTVVKNNYKIANEKLIKV